MILASLIYAIIMWLIWPLDIARFTAVLVLLFIFSAAMNASPTP